MISMGLKLVQRRFVRNRLFSFINMVGLAVGLATTIVILLFIRNELRYNSMFPDADRKYRMSMDLNIGEDEMFLARVCPGMGETYAENFPEIEQYVRFYELNKADFKYETQNEEISGVAHADAAVLDFFDLNLIYGQKEDALTRPKTIVLREDIAIQYFGDENPVGKMIHLEGMIPISGEFEITGVMEPFPQPSQFDYPALVSLSSLEVIESLHFWWYSPNTYTYLKVAEGTDMVALNEKMNGYFMENHGEPLTAINVTMTTSTISLKDLHFKDHAMDAQGVVGSMQYIYLFSSIAFLILVLACLNFINLSTAQATGRAKEVGIGKVLGAGRGRLIGNALLESVVYALLALAMAILFIFALSYIFNEMVSSDITIHLLAGWSDYLIAVLFAVTIGLVAGIYPAFVLTTFKPISVLKGNVKSGLKGATFRRIMVVFQFSVTIALLAGTFVVQKQMGFIRDKNLGFNQEQLLYFNVKIPEIVGHWDAMKNDLQQIPGVVDVASSQHCMGVSASGKNYFAEGMEEGQSLMFWNFPSDPDYVQTMGMTVLEGRGFNPEGDGDQYSVLINEAAANLLGWEEPVGKHIYEDIVVDDSGEAEKAEYTIVGVVKDFHFRSIHEIVKPGIVLLYRENPSHGEGEMPGYMNVRLETADISETIAQMDAVWAKYVEKKPFNYRFFDDQYASLYANEKRIQQLFITFASLAALVTCLGLFGLITFITEAMKREIAIRKVLGATEEKVVVMIVREFVLWLGIATVVAVPVSWFIMNKWLENFAYKTDVTIGTFVAAIAVTLFVTMFTVSFRTIKAALANPVTSLKHE